MTNPESKWSVPEFPRLRWWERAASFGFFVYYAELPKWHKDRIAAGVLIKETENQLRRIP